MRVFSPDTSALIRTGMEAVGCSHAIAWDIGIDLFDYQQVKFRADDIRARLEDGSRPCDQAWPKEWIQKFKQRIAGGMQP